MMPVAEAEAVAIHCPEDGRYAFFNSPYPAHHVFTGIDVFPGSPFGGLAPSPVSGLVTQVRRVRSPRGVGFEDAGFDVVTLIRSSENPERTIKLLHLVPEVGCGEEVEAGQPLGRLIRSGYFGPWTSPHVHVEVREPSDPLRARGGLTIRSLLGEVPRKPVNEMVGEVIESTPHYSMIALRGVRAQGLPAEVGGSTGLLDGGIPHYGWVGAHLGEEPDPNGLIRLCGRPIGRTRKVLGRYCLAECTLFTVRVEGVPVGLSLSLTPTSKRLKLKVVTSAPGALGLEESSEVTVEVK